MSMETFPVLDSCLNRPLNLFRICFITICLISLVGCSKSTVCWPLCGGSTDSGADSDSDSDEKEPSLSINDVSIKEGYTNSKAAIFTIELNPAASKVVIVKYKTMNDSKQ